MAQFLAQFPAPEEEGLLGLFPERPPSWKQQLVKPMRPEKIHHFLQGMQQDLVSSEVLGCGSGWARFHREVKYDGQSVTVAVLSNNRFLVNNRTAKERGGFLTGGDASSCFTPLALVLQVKFMAEACALYEGREAGFLEVPAMRKLFLENGGQNVPPYRLVFRVFGIVSVNPTGIERTGEDLTIVQTRDLMDRFLVKGNGLFEAADLVVYRACLEEKPRLQVQRQYSLRFERQLEPGRWSTVAAGIEEFRQHLLAEADALECEGFVLKKGKTCPSAQAEKACTDTYGIFRDPSMVKAKREFSIHVVACLVVEGAPDRIKQRMVWLYGKRTTGPVQIGGPIVDQRLGYAGDATGHAFIDLFLKTAECAFFYNTEAEKDALMSLDPLLLQTEPGRFVQLGATCTNFSKTQFTPIGIKNDARREALDFDLVTDTEALAMSHPHFRSAKLASDRMAVALLRHSKKPKSRRKRAASPPPPRLRAAYLAPQDAGVGPDPPVLPRTLPVVPVVPTTGITVLHGEPVTSLFLWRIANGINPRTGLAYA
jgi:hypothetical protein